MAHFPIGFISSWTNIIHPLGNPQENSWQAIVDPPSGWALDSGTPVYDGVSNRGVSVVGGQVSFVYDIAPPEEQLYTGGKTIMFSFETVSWGSTDNLFVSLEMIDVGTVAGFSGVLDSASSLAEGTAVRVSTDPIYSYANTTTAPVPPEIGVLAVRDDGAGNLLVRLFATDGTIIDDETANTPSDLGTFFDAQVKLRINMDTGDEIYVRSTYIHPTVALIDADIEQKARDWGWHDPYDMTPIIEETDWTIGSLPSGWTAFGNEAWNTEVYDTGNGSYWDTTSTPTYGGSWTRDEAPLLAGVQEFTIISHLDVAALTGGLYGATTLAGLSNYSTVSIDDFVSGFEFIAYDQDITIPWNVAGQIYIAMTYAVDGTMSCYVFDDSGLTTDSGMGATPTTELLNFFDTRNFTDTSSGFIKTVHTHFETNTVLDETDITTIVTGWGWTP